MVARVGRVQGVITVSMIQSFSRGIDTARIGACFMVVLLHVAAVEFHEFDDRWWASNFYDSLTRACVPVFLMITGVLLLNRQEDLPVFFRKRYVRVLPPLVFWSLFYLGWYTWQGEDYGGVLGGLKSMLSGPVAFHLWYLYAIVGIYLFVPFLRHIWQSASRAEQHLYLFLWMVASALPMMGRLAGSDVDVLNTYELGAFFGLLGYLFLGAYVHKAFSRQVRKSAYWWLSLFLFVLFSVLTMVATWLYSLHRGHPDPLFYDYLSPFVIAAAVCAFNVLYGAGFKANRAARLSEQSWSVLNQLAASTLGIYCVHIFVLDVLRNHTGLMQGNGSAWWAIPLAAVAVFAVTWALVSVLRTLRPLRHVT